MRKKEKCFSFCVYLIKEIKRVKKSYLNCLETTVQIGSCKILCFLHFWGKVDPSGEVRDVASTIFLVTEHIVYAGKFSILVLSFPFSATDRGLVETILQICTF